MKHILLTLAVTSLLATTAFALPIHWAAEEGDLAGVQAELDKGVDVNVKDYQLTTTPLHFAATKEVTELLIANGADVNAESDNGWTPLHFAARNGRKGKAELLIAAGADVNTKDDWKEHTPLHSAAEGGHKELAELLIASGADVNAKAEYGETPLDVAIYEDRTETAAFLRKHGGITDEELKALLDIATTGTLEAAKQAIANGADVNAKDWFENTPLHYAADNGHKEIVELLIANGADVNAKGLYGTPLHWAVAEIVELLIANGADVNAKDDAGWTPLDWAEPFEDDSPEDKANKKETADLLSKHGGKSGAEFSINVAVALGNIEAVKQHLATGADVNAKDDWGQTPLFNAVEYGQKEIVELLIAKGADVNVKIGDGWTPLHRAALYDHKEIGELLIANDADVNAKDEVGRTPLHWAAMEGHKEIAELLIDKGAGLEAGNEKGWTPLHYAATKEVAELLITEGADVNANNDIGKTPLHLAVDGGYKEIAELLIDKGADVNAKNWKKRGWTPLNYASTKEIAELLIAKGADVNAKDRIGVTPLEYANDEISDILRKYGGKTSEELKALMPRLEYGKNEWPFDFSFTATSEKTFVVEVTQDFKQWSELATIKGTGKQVKFIDPRQPLVPFKRNFYRVKVVE